MSEITKKSPRTETPNDSQIRPPAALSRAPSGFWPFLKTFFVGTAGIALLAVVGTLAGSAWLTANQRAEAEKPEPWTNPSFTTTAVTTGGMLARWMDNDGNLENGHSYIKGIYDLWKVKSPRTWSELDRHPERQSALPQLWKIELSQDTEKSAKVIDSDTNRRNAETLNRYLNTLPGKNYPSATPPSQ